MRDRSQFYLDMAILIGIFIAIFYLKMQTTGDSFSPFDGVMAVLNIGG